jgi:2-polyprenyl-3-methyl-5-hydroxy-6-metoxy-1,4-benzoquinol methylase
MSSEHEVHADHAQHEESADVAAARPEREAWNERYSGQVRVWSGAPNVELTRQIADLTPGRALDLGCGEGADAVWLARQGWKVTAVDVSDVALGRAAEHAAAAGLSEAIEFRHGNLLEDFPPGEFELVSAQFLYPQAETAREGLLRRAVQAVAPGGVALIESHAGLPEWEQGGEAHAQHGGHSQHSGHGGHAGMKFAKPTEILASLRLADGEWDVLVCEEHERVQNGPDGRPTTRTDSTLKLRRH